MKTLKLRLYPTKAQKEQINQHIGCCRFIYNRSLERRISHYNDTEKTISKFELQKEITKLKKLEEFSWLKEVNSQSLQKAVDRVDSAFSAFFKKKSGFPKFKSKKQKQQSFCVPQNFRFDDKGKWIKVPKIGVIKFRDKMNFKNWHNPRQILIVREGDQYFACVVCDCNITPSKEEPSYKNSVGIDLGVHSYVTLSNGTKIEKPRFEPQGKGARKRKDFLHKLSTKLVDNQNWKTIVIEEMRVKDLLEKTNIKNINKATQDCAWSMFTNMLEYKCKERGKNFITVSSFEGASRACTCGKKKNDLTVSDREWTCECGLTHDRDVLAAQNIRTFGITGGTPL